VPLRSVNRHRQSSSRSNDSLRFRHRPYAFDTSSVVPLRSSSCQSPDLVLPRPFPSVLTTMAFDHSRRRWFGTCSCQPVPRVRPSSIKQLHTLGPPRPFALVAHSHRRSAPAGHQPFALAHAGRKTRRRTSANTGWPVMARLPHLAAFPSSAGSIYCLHPAPHSAQRLAPPTTSGSTSEPIGPRPACVGTPAAGSAESNRNSPSGPRRTRLDTRPVSDRVSPPAPGAPIAPVGTHTSNPGSRPQRSAPGSTGSPSALPGRAPSVFPTASASHSLSECTRVAPPAAGRSSSAAIPEFLPETPLRLGLTRRSVPSSRHPPRALLGCVAPVPMPLPTHPCDRSGRTKRKTGTSAPAWPFGPASVSVEKLSPAVPALSPFPASPSLRLPESP